MSKKLILIRHAQAEVNGTSDFERQLTQEGQRIARHLGQWMQDQELIPEMFYSSTAKRAVETTSSLAEVLGISGHIQQLEALYQASVRTFLQEINQVNEEFELVAFVGHNPTITYLAEYISGESVNNMAPGGLVLLQLKVASWAEVSEKGTDLIQYLAPEQIS